MKCPRTGYQKTQEKPDEQANNRVTRYKAMMQLSNGIQIETCYINIILDLYYHAMKERRP